MIDCVHVITSLELGGAQRMLVKLLERVEGRTARARVVSLVDGGPLADELLARGIEVQGLGMRAGVPDPRALLRLRRVVARARPAVVQTWLYHADLAAALALTGLSPRPALVWSLRCLHHASRARGLAARAAPAFCARLSGVPDVVLANSEAARRSHADAGWHPRRFEVIPNGFDTERFRPDPGAGAALRAELGIGPDTVLVGLVGRLDPVKGHAAAVAAAARLAARFPALRLVLVGPGLEEGSAGLASLRRAHGAPENVLALGARDDVPRVMAGLDVLLVASAFSESFPNVVGEALAAGTPCVATDVGATAEVVGDAGWIVGGTDAAALAEGLARALEAGAEERAARGARGRARVLEHFELGAVARRYEALWEELAGRPR